MHFLFYSSLCSCLYLRFITVQIHTVNHYVGPVRILVLCSTQTHGLPTAIKSDEMSLVDCHSYWQRPCKTQWVRWSKAPVNLGFTSLTPVDQLWCKQSASRALVGPIQYAVILLLWCNSASHPVPSLHYGFSSTCIIVGDSVTIVSISLFLHLQLLARD